MSYHETVGDLAEDAEQMEQVYHAALKAGETDAFKEAIDAGHTTVPENLLYAAWFHRLKYTVAQAKGYVVAWAWVIPLAVINGLLLWLFSGERFMITIKGFQGDGYDFLPAVAWLAAPLSAVFVLIYLTAAGRKRWRLSAINGILTCRRRRLCSLDLPPDRYRAIPGTISHPDGFASTPSGLGGCRGVPDRQAP